MPVSEAITKHKIIVGSIICTILLLLGGFLYMWQEGEDEGFDQIANAEALKQEDVRIVQEGEACGEESVVCGPGLTCADPVDGKWVCVSISPDGHPFIAAILPEGMELEAGAYRAEAGKPIQVTVRAVNVSGGALYLKRPNAPEDSFEDAEKVSDLQSRDIANEYEGTFALEKGMEGSLYAIMHGNDGQEVRLSVNVATR